MSPSGTASNLEGIGSRSALSSELAALLGPDAIQDPGCAAWHTDASASRGVHGRPDAVVAPRNAEDVARALGWCYEHGVAVIARGGGTGYSGGAVAVGGGVILALHRLNHVECLEPERWRLRVQAGVRTAHVHRLARENGLLFAPDPGAAESSQIGGNIATNAGGPHAFKYGSTGSWVTGLQAAIAPGELIEVGGPVRKDVAGYDLRALLIGSEGTLGVITAAWLRLQPAPAAVAPVLAFYASEQAGCQAVLAVLASGCEPGALEYLDAVSLQAAQATLPGGVSQAARFLVMAEAQGSIGETQRARAELIGVLGEGALEVRAPQERRAQRELWDWRSGVSLAVSARRGGKLSEDITVPVEHLAEAVAQTREIGAAHLLEACSWGHAGDGNLHATFLFDPADRGAIRRAEAGARDLLGMALGLGGSVSGEHGIGWVKRGALSRQWAPGAVAAHRAVKAAMDPRGLLNPGKKEP